MKTPTIQFLIPLVKGRETWHEKLMASLPNTASVLTMVARSSIKDSRKELLDRSTSEYVAILDDDDELDTSNLEELINYVETTKPRTTIMTSSKKIDFYGKVVGYLNDLTGVTYTNFLDKGRFPHQLMVCKKEEALRAWHAANTYIMSVFDEYKTLQEPNAVDPRISFDPAFCWEILLKGNVEFYAPCCYLWRLHTRDQIHVVGNKSHFKVVSHYREEYKKRYLNETAT